MKNRNQIGLILLLLFVAGLPRLAGLGARGLWLDEAYSALLSQSSAGRIFEMLRFDSGPPLYYLFLRLWSAVAGSSELALRLPSAIAGILTAVACYAAGRRLGFGRGAAFSALFVALSPLLVYHAQDARYYAFLPLIGALALLSLDRLVESPSRGRWIAYAMTLVLAEYLHNYGLLLIPAAYAYVAFRRDARSGLRELHAAHAIALFLYLPWVPSLIAQIRFGGTEWIERFFSATAPLASLEAFVPGGEVPPYIGVPDAGAFRPLALVIFVALLIPLVVRMSRSRGRPAPVAAVVAFAVIPLLIIYVFSIIIRPIYVVGRADILFYPAFALLAGVAVASLRPRWLLPIVAGVALVPAVFTLVGYHQSDVKSGDRDLAHFLIERVADGEVVVCCGLTRAATEYYLDRGGRAARLVSFPVDVETHPGNLPIGKIRRRNPNELFEEFWPLLKREFSGRSAGGRFWAVLTPDPLGRVLESFLDREFTRRKIAGEGWRMGILGVPVRVIEYRVTNER